MAGFGLIETMLSLGISAFALSAVISSGLSLNSQINEDQTLHEIMLVKDAASTFYHSVGWHENIDTLFIINKELVKKSMLRDHDKTKIWHSLDGVYTEIRGDFAIDPNTLRFDTRAIQRANCESLSYRLENAGYTLEKINETAITPATTRLQKIDLCAGDSNKLIYTWIDTHH